MSDPQFPRVLIFNSSVFNPYTGSGVFLTNLFRGWPSGKLAIAHGDSFLPDTAVCKNMFPLGPDELHPAMPFRLFWSPRPRIDAGTSSTPIGSSSGGSLKKAVSSVFRRIVGEELPWEIAITPALSSWIEAFQPELIYTFVGGPYMKAAMRISQQWKIPLVAHMMDDWPAKQASECLPFPFYRQKRLREVRMIFQKAALRLGICDEMSDAYEKRYGVGFSSFQNSTDVAERQPYARKHWKRGQTFRLTYAGSIVPTAQLHSLIDVARAVSALAAEGRSIELNIYSPWAAQYEKQLRVSSAVALHPGLNEKEIFKTLTESDVLLVPVNFDQSSLVYIRYSMPAKIPLYMISGTPILAYGPSAAASIHYAQKENWAHLVTEPNLNRLKQAITALYEDESLRESLGRVAMAVAKKNHDSERVRSQFRKMLSDIIPSKA